MSDIMALILDLPRIKAEGRLKHPLRVPPNFRVVNKPETLRP